MVCFVGRQKLPSAQQVFALAAAILALGAMYCPLREQDRREQA
jgi:hypothetical protein